MRFCFVEGDASIWALDRAARNNKRLRQPINRFFCAETCEDLCGFFLFCICDSWRGIILLNLSSKMDEASLFRIIIIYLYFGEEKEEAFRRKIAVCGEPCAMHDPACALCRSSALSPTSVWNAPCLT